MQSKKLLALYGLLILVVFLTPTMPSPQPQTITQPTIQETKLPTIPPRLNFWDLIPAIENWLSELSRNAYRWYANLGYLQPITPAYAFSRTGAITLNTGENYLWSAVVDQPNGYAYFGTDTSPGMVVKVNLATFTRVGALTLNTGENSLFSAVIDQPNGYAYFGTYTSPSIVVKVNFGTFSSSLTDVGKLTDSVRRVQSVGKPLTDLLSFSDVLSGRITGRLISDVLGLSDTVTGLTHVTNRVLSDVQSITDALSYVYTSVNAHYYPSPLIDTQRLVDSLNRQYFGQVTFIEGNNLADSLIRLRNVPVTLSEILSLIDSISRFGPPAVPGSFTAVKDAGNPTGAIDLSWTSDPNANPATVNYVLQRSPDQSTWTTVCTCTTMSFVDTGLSPATGYYYRIRAYNGQNSAWSGIASAVTDSYLVSGGGSPTTGTYTLVVLIKDLLGTPLQGASVTQGSTSLLTDTSGIVNFGTLTGGSYTLEVSASGCTDTSQSINLTSDHPASNPFIVNVQCGSQTATTGTAPNLPAIEFFILPILGVALAGMAIAVYSNERSKKKRKLERQ